MPSFDIKSELNFHEIANGVDQANRIIQTRFDFKGTGAKIVLDGRVVILVSQEEFQLHQMFPILQESLTKRGVDLKSLRPDKIEISTARARQNILLVEGIDKEIAKKITHIVRSLKSKLQTSVQGETIRVTGKKRDDLQEAIQSIKKENFIIPLQFKNFRD